MKHMMVDLETLGTLPGCAIVSVGAVMFSDEGLGREFYGVVDVDTTPLTIGGGAVKWWMQQSEEARTVFNDAGAKSHLHVMSDFLRFWNDEGAEFFWCHGAPFDAPILEAGLRRVFDTFGARMQTPWKFQNIRDTRTLFAMADVKPERITGTHHNALDDAKAQALCVIEGYKRIGLERQLGAR